MYRFRLFLFLIFFFLSSAAAAVDIAKLPVFDAHIHYSHDVWDKIDPERAIRLLRDAGVKRALVSSSGDEGTQKLYQAAPDMVIPVLRPYRKRGTLKSWMHDETVIPYLKQRLAKYRYVAIGEFHIDGMEADLPVIREVVKLAKQYNLILHVHSDALAVEQIFKQDPDAKILWAHAGFEFAPTVRRMLKRYSHLWADLSFRRDAFGNGRFAPGWEALFADYADRFMLGLDTYTPQRWLEIDRVMRWQRDLLKALPAEARRKIAFENGERVFSKAFDNKHE